jgi:hypothetical protein
MKDFYVAFVIIVICSVMFGAAVINMDQFRAKSAACAKAGGTMIEASGKEICVKVVQTP